MSSERRQEQFERLARTQDLVLDLTNWHEYLKCLHAAGFRSRHMITSANAILFCYSFWLIGRSDFGMSFQDLRRVIGRWFFMAHSTGRYSSSPESQFEADLGRLNGFIRGDPEAFESGLERIIKSNFTNDYWDISLPNRLDTSSSRSPVLFAYLASLNILGAEALFSDVRINQLLSPSLVPPRSIERHHLFPRKYLESINVTGMKQINAIANMTYLDWSENSAISSSAPQEYWPVMSARISEIRLKTQVHLHALPVGWEQLDYPTFLERRRDLMAQVVREGFRLTRLIDLPQVCSLKFPTRRRLLL